VGILLAFAGVIIIVADPDQFTFTIGAIYLVGAAMVGAIANILMKRIDPMPAMRLQAWIGLFSIVPLALMSLVWETGQADAYAALDWRVYAASIFAVSAVIGAGSSLANRPVRSFDATA
jgi:O-acetylserine/cysteine efflux transporter